jgi:hypothetical protein
MKIEQQIAVEYFALGYLRALLNERDFYDTPISGCDDWVQVDDYDINFMGEDYADGVSPKELKVVVYPRGWESSLSEPLLTFTTRA